MNIAYLAPLTAIVVAIIFVVVQIIKHNIANKDRAIARLKRNFADLDNEFEHIYGLLELLVPETELVWTTKSSSPVWVRRVPSSRDGTWLLYVSPQLVDLTWFARKLSSLGHSAEELDQDGSPTLAVPGFKVWIIRVDAIKADEADEEGIDLYFEAAKAVVQKIEDDCLVSSMEAQSLPA